MEAGQTDMLVQHTIIANMLSHLGIHPGMDNSHGSFHAIRGLADLDPSPKGEDSSFRLHCTAEGSPLLTPSPFKNIMCMGALPTSPHKGQKVSDPQGL